MKKYKSQYSSKSTSRLRWFKPALVNKQGQGPSKEWLKMLRKDAKAKLAASIYGESVESKANSEWIEKNERDKAAIRNRKRIQATDESADEQHIYHVTHTHHVPKIQKQGIMPMKTSNWVKAGDKERYGGGEVYAFTHKADAEQWAGRMDWAHHQKLGSGKISIITAKRPHDREFEVDHNDPLSQAGKKGDWIKTRGHIAPHHIVAVEPYKPRRLGEEMKDRIGKATPSVEQIAKKHGVSADAIEAQIAKGIAVEREHTNSDAEAHEIARDHLDEFPDYYDRLDDMEKKAKKDMKEEFLNEAVGSNEKGVLHELLVGYHLRGKSHMEKHPDVNGDSPKQAHDKIKANIHPDEYKAINHRAKAAAADIASHVSKHGKLHDVHWTSKPGDIHRSTGIHATQKEDPSDIVIHTKKGGKITHHGVSLKVTDRKSGEVPVSNPGMKESTYGIADKHITSHRKALLKAHPKLKSMSSSSDRKEYVRKNPKVQESIRDMNSKVIPKVAKNLANHLSSMGTADLAKHLRNHILKANPTPLQKAGHTHLRHTTHGSDGNYTFSHMDPVNSHEHILKDHKNITVHHSGTSVIFSHKGKPFARHRMKFMSQSDPMSSLKGSGELIGKHSLKEAAKDVLRGYKMMKNDPPVPAPKKPHPVPKGYERTKDSMGFNVLRKKMNEMMSVGSGAIAGMPTATPPDETPVGIMGPVRRRKKFAGKQVFVVDPTTFHKAYLGKRKYEHYEKYLEGCDIADEIREFGRTNWAEPIIIENEQTGAMVYLKYGSK